MADAPRNPGKAGEPPGNGAVRSPGRRRLLQAGVSAAPIVMTVASRPVLAAGCDSPSGFTSLNQSHPGPGTCTGKGPVAWKTAGKDNWPAPLNADPKFKDVQGFGSTAPSGSSFDPNKKLSQVLANTDNTAAWVLARYIIAAYLNALSGAYGTSTLLSTATVANIWSEYSNNLSYSPRAGATWNYLEIVAYLKSTMVTS
jgi:hypothetical protein